MQVPDRIPFGATQRACCGALNARTLTRNRCSAAASCVLAGAAVLCVLGYKYFLDLLMNLPRSRQHLLLRRASVVGWFDQEKLQRGSGHGTTQGMHPCTLFSRGDAGKKLLLGCK